MEIKFKYSIVLPSFGGGRINKTNNAYDINYFITDHLGSTRVIASSAGQLNGYINYYPFGKVWEDSAYPAPNTRYLFSNKEKQTVGDLGWLDFTARMYANSEMPIFTTPDPLAEKYYSLSPYMYCVGNPLIYVDPSGMFFQSVYGDAMGNYYDIKGNDNAYYVASPAFDTNGNFLGTDDEGYSGNILIFDDPTQFTQGMAHSEAVKKGRTLRSHLDVNYYALNRIINHVANNTILPNGSTLYSSHFFAYHDNLSINVANGQYLGKIESTIFDKLLAILGITNPLVGKYIMTVDLSSDEWTVENLKLLTIHEIWGHGIMGYGDATKTHHLIYEAEIESRYFEKSTERNKYSNVQNYYDYYKKETGRKAYKYQSLINKYK